MTDLATRPDADEAPLEDATTPPPVGSAADVVEDDTASMNTDGAAPTYAWAPAEPAPRNRRLGLWIGIPAAIAAVALVASSLVLIAPGTSVAGVPVGGLTPGAAADAIQNRLAETTIVLTGAGGDVTVTGADLSASVDARSLAQAAFAANPAWNPSAWFSAPLDAPVRIDSDAATSALRAAVPALYAPPVDATVTFDEASARYVATPAEDGTGVDVETLRSALEAGFAAGQTTIDVEPALAPIGAETPTFVAAATVTNLNGMLDSVGFYVGTERTVPIDPAVAASWITVSAADRGTFAISADASAIQASVDALPTAVNRDAVNARAITDSAGNVLREESTGVSGRTLDSTEGVANGFAEQLAAGDAVYELPVTEVAFTTTTLARRIEVNISQQRAYLFENGAVVNSYLISSGLPGHDTDYGNFRIYAKLASQNMGDEDLIKADYYTPNVPWVSYYNADEALHGAYWHNNFGSRMSHGCVNMPISAAQFVYDWAPIGTEVWVHP